MGSLKGQCISARSDSGSEVSMSRSRGEVTPQAVGLRWMMLLQEGYNVSSVTVVCDYWLGAATT